jgi:hypothetical protein
MKREQPQGRCRAHCCKRCSCAQQRQWGGCRAAPTTLIRPEADAVKQLNSPSGPWKHLLAISAALSVVSAGSGSPIEMAALAAGSRGQHMALKTLRRPCILPSIGARPGGTRECRQLTRHSAGCAAAAPLPLPRPALCRPWQLLNEPYAHSLTTATRSLPGPGGPARSGGQGSGRRRRASRSCTGLYRSDSAGAADIRGHDCGAWRQGGKQGSQSCLASGLACHDSCPGSCMFA